MEKRVAFGLAMTSRISFGIVYTSLRILDVGLFNISRLKGNEVYLRDQEERRGLQRVRWPEQRSGLFRNW
jgi:hypothetical protein